MSHISGPTPESHGQKRPIESKEEPKASKKFKDNDSQPIMGFAQKAWGFDAEEAKKFISTLANTIISQIKHEDEKAKEIAEKLKQAEQGQDE